MRVSLLAISCKTQKNKNVEVKITVKVSANSNNKNVNKNKAEKIYLLNYMKHSQKQSSTGFL